MSRAPRLLPVALSAALLSAALLSGCAAVTLERPSPEPRAATFEAPELWARVQAEQSGEVEDGWLSSFDDPEMETLVREALDYNPDLLGAAARLRGAKEGTILGRAPRLPAASLSGAGSGRGTKFRETDGGLSPWEHGESYGLSLNLSWEIDLWGRLRDLHHASLADYEASVADFRGARLSLAANTAGAWINLIAANQQLALARQTRDSFLANYRITERNYRAGDPTASPLDVQFGRNNVASAEQGILARQLARDEAIRTLEVLLGRYPSATIVARNSLPRLSLRVPAGLPSELLLRRPDLVAASADLRASALRADASRKNLLPSIRLTSGGSLSSEKLLDLLAEPDSIAWNVAASLSQPLFQGGALEARARQALTSNESAIQSFASQALGAFREVESALARDRSLAAQEEFLQIELAQANLAEAQSSRDYSEGIVGILAVLEGQRRAFSARNRMISLKTQRLLNRIDLHLALGGDFGLAEDEPAPRMASGSRREL